MIDTITSTGTQIFGPEFFKRPTLLDEFVLIKIGSQISLTPKKDPIKPFWRPYLQISFCTEFKALSDGTTLCTFTLLNVEKT